jgi:hypothetical protein
MPMHKNITFTLFVPTYVTTCSYLYKLVILMYLLHILSESFDSLFIYRWKNDTGSATILPMYNLQIYQVLVSCKVMTPCNQWSLRKMQQSTTYIHRQVTAYVDYWPYIYIECHQGDIKVHESTHAWKDILIVITWWLVITFRFNAQPWHTY